MNSNTEEYSFPLFMLGSASTWAPDEPDEAEQRVQLLRQAVRDVTGKEVPQPPKRTMGFLP